MCASSSLAEGTVKQCPLTKRRRRNDAASQESVDVPYDVTTAIRILVVVVVIMVAVTVIGRRKGYGFGGRTFARCRKGHLFTTLWIPGASVKAVRLGWARFQYCPVGKHWSLVVPVKEADLTQEEREEGAQNRDISIP
jgi:hypothetical protein